MNRYTAFLYHLGISLVIFAVLGYLIVFHWYPGFFFQTDGGWQGIRLIALVDLVLGPALTLIVYKKGKPGLKFDLSAIAMLQTICLTAGIYVVYGERPLAIVFSDGLFHSMSADDYHDSNQPVPDLSRFDTPDLPWLTVELPEDLEAVSAIRLQAMQQRTPLATLAEFYRPFDTDDVDPERDAFPLTEIERRDPSLLDRFTAENGGKRNDYLFVGFGTRYQSMLIAVRKEDGFKTAIELPPISDSGAPNDAT